MRSDRGRAPIIGGVQVEDERAGRMRPMLTLQGRRHSRGVPCAKVASSRRTNLQYSSDSHYFSSTWNIETEHLDALTACSDSVT